MEIKISKKQEEQIIDLASKNVKVKDILLQVFKEPNLDARSAYGRAVKEVIEKSGLTPNTRKRRFFEEDFELTEDDKEFIFKNYGELTIPEIRERLYPGSKKQGREWHAIKKYVAEKLPAGVPVVNKVDVAVKIERGPYSPPKSFDAGIALIKKATNNHKINGQSLPKPQRIAVENMVINMGIKKFLSQINSYSTTEDRDLFESEFVRLTWDKGDLTSEDVSKYIDLCHEIVNQKNLQRSISQLLEARVLNQDERMTMTSVENEKSYQKSLDDCFKRIRTLENAVAAKRSDRLKNKISSEKTFSALVEYWRVEENRLKLLEMSEMKKEAMRNELTKFSTMDDIDGEIWGVSEEEFLN